VIILADYRLIFVLG